MIAYRAAEEGDLSGILQLFDRLKSEKAQVGFTDIDKIEELMHWLENPRIHLYVASDPSNKVVGVLRGKQGESHKKHSVYVTAAIAKAYRGKKIAKHLTLFGLEDLAQKDIQIARTYVYSNNKASLCTLLSCGFTISGVVHMHHYSVEDDQYVDDIIVHKILY